ncbi:MAG: phenylalanine--tRNA ligase subunit beta [Deltaproteobacteria bacterium]|nr:phenylalanine--tRNA ligase subunit beta [Deltaproteobacteria bacterium]
MPCSYNWLKEYAAGLPSPKAAAEALTMSGTEVESVTETGVSAANVVTAEVLTVVKHPNADKLSLCGVRTDKGTHSIVCGAKNMKPGDKVALAMPGAELPGGIKIKKSRIRGVESEGMMCSEHELGIKDASDGILILPPDTPLGVEIGAILGGRDALLEVSITPNRADLLSIRGVARELSAITGAAFKDKEIRVEETGATIDGLVSVSIAEGAPCGRYCARVIKGAVIGQSPAAVKARLEAAGIRSINNVVDVTNYVMLETGQPLHAFDLAKVGGGRINVRLASDGERLETIDGKARVLDPSMLVIADVNGPVALAGVMGGKASEVSDATKDILLEAAWFVPSSVRKTAKKTGLPSESSYRFERGVDIEGARAAIDMAADMIIRLAGGAVAKGVIDVCKEKQSREPVRFRVKRAESLLGTALTGAACLDIFKRLGMDAKDAGEGVLTATPPSFRVDLNCETDLIEEIARINGYDNIPPHPPVARLVTPEIPGSARFRTRAAAVLAGAGFSEVVNYSFVSRRMLELAGGGEPVEILNPLSDELSVMRQSLAPSLLGNLCYNLQRKNADVRIFEIAPVFQTRPGEKLPEERWKIAGLMHGSRYGEGWNAPGDRVDFYDCKGEVERLLGQLGAASAAFNPKGAPVFLHPGKSASIELNGANAGYIGEAHPGVNARLDLKRPVYIFELDAASIARAASPAHYSAIPRFPESARDIAFVIGESMPYEEIIRAIERLDAKLIERVSVFDVYYGEGIEPGYRSMALRIIYRSAERTLRYEEVEELHGLVGRELTSRFGAVIR